MITECPYCGIMRDLKSAKKGELRRCDVCGKSTELEPIRDFFGSCPDEDEALWRKHQRDRGDVEVLRGIGIILILGAVLALILSSPLVFMPLALGGFVLLGLALIARAVNENTIALKQIRRSMWLIHGSPSTINHPTTGPTPPA